MVGLRGEQPALDPLNLIRIMPAEGSVHQYQRFITVLTFFFVAVALSAAPAVESDEAPLRILTHDSWAMSETTADEFSAAIGAPVEVIQAGDAGLVLNHAILAAGNPVADILYGIDNTFLSRAVAADLFLPYQPAAIDQIGQEFRVDRSGLVVPIDHGDVCLNYDRLWFESRDLPAPTTLDDLTDRRYRGLLVVQDATLSSPGLAFLLATIARYGDPAYLDYWRRLVDNDLLVVASWEAAYYQEFSGSSGRGPRPIVVSYSSSPPFEVLYSDPPMAEAPTAVITAPGSCFRQIEFAGILRGTRQVELAQAGIEFLLSVSFQKALPLSMFVFPVRTGVALDPVFLRHMQNARAPALLAPQLIADNRDRWLRAWREVALAR